MPAGVADPGDEPEDGQYAQYALLLIALLAGIDAADCALLPASFRALEQDLSLTPDLLAHLAVCQGAAATLCSPFWGSLADNGVSRKLLLVLATLLWSLCTFLLAFVDDFKLMVPLRIINGAANGALGPIIQSFVAVLSPRSSVGFNYGKIGFVAALGACLTSSGCTAVSNTLIYGQQGWRVAFVIIAVLSMLIAGVVHVFLIDKRAPWNPGKIGIFTELHRFASYLTIPTFLVIVAQGMFGCIPWAAMMFFTMYLQYSGMTDLHAGIVSAMLMIGGAFGVVLGGAVGDLLASWSIYHGRPLCAQITVFLGIPIICVVLVGGHYVWAVTAVLMFALGLLAHWAGVGCNRPILLEIVPQKNWGGAFAWLIALEGTSGAVFGASAVGFLSMRVFHYAPTTESVDKMSAEIREQNKNALGKSLFFMTCGPWCICFLLYGILHVTYKRDIMAVKEETDEHTPLIQASDGHSQ